VTTPRFVDTTTTILKGVALWLDEMGLAHYDEAGAGYDGTAVKPVVFLQQAFNDPASAITLWVYSGPERGDHREDLSVSLWRIQIECRVPANSPSLAASDLADAVYDRLQARSHVKLPNGTRLLLCKQVIRGPVDLDASGRFYRADSYEISTNPGDIA
jgi:hypothetical protein